MSFWAMPTARATHPSGRSLFHVSALCVGIAIALAGCANQEPPDTRTAYQRAFDRCIMELSGMAHAATAPIIAECRDQGRLASGMSASGQDPKGLEAKPASPTRKAGDAQ